MLCTSTPLVVYSSRKAAVAFPFSAALPSPTRTTTKSPNVNAAARPLLAQRTAARQSATLRNLEHLARPTARTRLEVTHSCFITKLSRALNCAVIIEENESEN